MDELRHVAYHEAGHAVIGFLHGADLKTLQLACRDDGTVPCDLGEATPDAQALIYAAGRAAEMLFFHEALTSINATDYARVCMMRLSMSSERDRAFESRINAMISDYSIAIMLLAEELIQAGSKCAHEAQRVILSALPRDLDEIHAGRARLRPQLMRDEDWGLHSAVN